MRFNDKVYLASGSPRRRELLHNLFKDIKYLKSSLDEPFWQKNQDPKDYLSHCLEVKWRGAEMALATHFGLEIKEANFCMLVADTTVDLKGQLLEKPKDARDAERMLKELSGKTHIVRTGLILGRYKKGVLDKKSEFFVESKVSFYPLSAAEIKAYVKSGQPMDKAGAYGFQDQALKFVSSLEGSYLNVVGLPLLELESHAEKLGVK